MLIIDNKSKCNGCHACYSICPKNCIEMKRDEEGFLYPEINTELCINCNKCEKVCPVLNGKTENANSLQIGYAAFNKDEQVREKSSSGGIFTLLAEYILSQNGIVIGAAMSDDCKSVHHIVVDNIAGLEKLRGSKYVQSSIEHTYTSAKEYLEVGKKVLFTGTPCQIGGLLSFLGKEYDNLYTQDLICHGVPSPMVWEKYVTLMEKKENSTTKRTFFRHKKYGWKRYALLLEYSNNKAYHNTLDKDLYLKGFLANIYLRPSCYDCAFKTYNRQADITLADFWGVNNIYSKMDDDKGTSFIWIHSNKGKKLFEVVSNNIKYKNIELSEALKYNSAAVRSCLLPKNRQLFYKNINKIDLKSNIRKYVRNSLKKRISRFLGKIKRKLLR